MTSTIECMVVIAIIVITWVAAWIGCSMWQRSCYQPVVDELYRETVGQWEQINKLKNEVAYWQTSISRVKTNMEIIGSALIETPEDIDQYDMNEKKLDTDKLYKFMNEASNSDKYGHLSNNVEQEPYTNC